MLAYQKYGKTSSGKCNSGRKPLLTDRDRRILHSELLKQSHKTKITAELNSHLKNEVSLKTVRRELLISNIYDKTTVANPLITPYNANKKKMWCLEYKTWSPDVWKRAI